MRRNRKSNIKKERIIMIASSAFVLAALTMTGVYMKERSVESKDDGYSMDYASLENSADDKYEEIAQNEQVDAQDNMVAQNDADTNTNVAGADVVQGNSTIEPNVEPGNLEDDLDYMPLEVGSSLIEIPGLTDGQYTSDQEELADLEAVEESEDEEASTQNIVVADELHFAEADGLVRPTAGDILLHYSMDGSIYFETLDQYKYNPAVMFSAEEGSTVIACADGKVVNIYEDAQIGHAVTIDLGDGYQVTYGQLENIEVTLDSYVDAGDTIGSVAAPTKYFSLEGCNLYFQLTKDGAPVNPENLF